MKITKEEKRLCVEHYNRMIAFALTQDPTSPASIVDMSVEIDERPSSDDCVLCKEYRGELIGPLSCSRCPLVAAGHGCLHSESLYEKMMTSGTWGEFVRAAIDLRDVLYSLPERGEEQDDTSATIQDTRDNKKLRLIELMDGIMSAVAGAESVEWNIDATQGLCENEPVSYNFSISYRTKEYGR